MRIFTHMRVDLDAVSSVWAARQFMNGYADAEVVFVSANWNGDGLGEDDIAVDIEAGGKGMKGVKDQDGTVHSCFGFIVSNYACEEDQRALAHLVRFIDVQDSRGSAVEYLLPDVAPDIQELFSQIGINAVLRALQSNIQDDATVVQCMAAIFDGMLKNYRSSVRAAKWCDDLIVQGAIELLFGERIAIMHDIGNMAVQHKMFQRGVEVQLYIDGYNMGLVRRDNDGVRMDHPVIMKVIENACELDEWFVHSSGFLCARGTQKAPRYTYSRVDPYTLAAAVVSVLDG